MEKITHFSHPQHPLRENNRTNRFTCDGCKVMGSGIRFRCEGCDFDLHHCCAACPKTISLFMHPEHRLILLDDTKKVAAEYRVRCDVCMQIADGMFYHCPMCRWDAHPLCTQLQPTAGATAHPGHVLTLVPPTASTECTGCREACVGWLYRCGRCDVNLHPRCLHVQSGIIVPAAATTEEESDREAGGAEITTCSVCMDGSKGAAYIPCGHSFCRPCSREVWVSRGSCPVCNGDIHDILDLY